ncbi:Gibberellin-regulated protein 8 [Bienertia sinuspersici]
MKMSMTTTFLLISLVLCSTLLDITNAASQPPAQASGGGFCNSKCSGRCALKGVHSRCMKYCMMCCDKCRCVPSGTSGHLDECPCYRDWKAPNGRPKCP